MEGSSTKGETMAKFAEIEGRFKTEHISLLQAAGFGGIRAETDTNVISVYIIKHLTHSETGLPLRWEKYTVSVEYRRLAHEPQDYTDLMLRKFYTAEPFRDEGHIDSFKKEYREQLHRLKGLTLLSLAKLKCGTITLMIVVSDWENVSHLEERLQTEFGVTFPGCSAPKGAGFWGGRAVSIIRDQYVPLIEGEEYLDQLLVGSRAGAGGMTAGAILKGENSLFMLQCGHAYNKPGEDAWAPSATTIEVAMDHVFVELKTAEGSRKELLEERHKILTRAKNCSEYIVIDGRAKARYNDRNISSLVPLSIGKVEAFLPKQFDACLIKLHLSKKFGVAKSLCWPPNCLRPSTTISKERVDPRPLKPELNEWNAKWGQYADVPESNTASIQREKPTVDNLPDTIIKLSELDNAGLITKFGKGEECLMKFGARSGYSEFWIGYDEVLLDGRECAAIVPVRGARAFAGDTIVEGGDSSSPVVDKEGVMHGMVSAKHLQIEVAYMVLTSQIIKAAEEMGYKLELA